MNIQRTCLNIASVLVLLSLMQPVNAAHISGNVTDSDENALEGVMVTARHDPSGFGGVAISKADGSYFIDDLADGEYLLVFGKKGFATKEDRATLTSEGLNLPTLAMKRSFGFAIFRRPRPDNYSVVEIHYATDRARVTNEQTEFDYSGDRSDSLEYGIAEVAIPRDHRLGEFESPSIWKLQFRENPNKHVTLLRVVPGDDGGLSRALEDSAAALVFVHGFNVLFKDAARRAAQLSYDLKFNGTPILYSWPSNGAIQDYLADHTNAERSSARFAEFIAQVGKHAETVHVVAHSMGNQVLIRGLDLLSQRDDLLLPIIDEVALVAPDVDSEIFQLAAPRIFPLGDRVTLYVSANDKALILSKRLRGGYPRLGDFDADSGPTTMVGLDTIDVSLVESSFLGHSYYGDNRSVIADLFNLITTRKGPASRFGLVQAAFGEKIYWQFKP